MAINRKISVVIPTYNRRALLGRTLATVVRQDFPSSDFEIVVVIDGSTDGSAEFVRSQTTACGLTVIEQENRGRAAARNAGIRVARGEVILFLDDDVRCIPTLLRSHWHAQSKEEHCVNVGPVVPDADLVHTLAGRLEVERETKLVNDWNRTGGLRWPHDIFVGLNCSVPRELVEQIGGFDETFVCREDTEFGLRLWKTGMTFRFDPDSIVHHMGAWSSRDYAEKRAEQFVLNEMLLCRKHPEYRRFSPLAAWLSGGASQRAMRRLLSMGRPLVRILSFLCSTTEVFANQQVAQRVGTKALRLWASINRSKCATDAVASSSDFKSMFTKRVSVLAYHRIGALEPGANPELTISPRMFERQMSWLARRGYHTILPSDWIAWIEKGTALPGNPIILSFDDAYASVAEKVLPILVRFGFRGVVFAPSALLGSESKWDALRGWKPLPLMSVDELGVLSRAGFEIGSHTRTHEDLDKPCDLADQVNGSVAELQHIVGKAVTSFCYPYGHVSKAAVVAARKQYCTAFTCTEGRNSLKTDPLLLRRTVVMPTDTMLDFRLRARLGTSPIGNIVGWGRRKLRNVNRNLVGSRIYKQDARAEDAVASRVSSLE